MIGADAAHERLVEYACHRVRAMMPTYNEDEAGRGQEGRTNVSWAPHTMKM